ncbi:hypothetical protein LIER_43870 [Lithospermum erythrorhizon]|uniref:Uncharacterized protein n=1 Tax=Lithospermum erythrorhizon TaxID=34254 RepID=A0AAV3R3N3_LITER
MSLKEKREIKHYSVVIQRTLQNKVGDPETRRILRQTPKFEIKAATIQTVRTTGGERISQRGHGLARAVVHTSNSSSIVELDLSWYQLKSLCNPLLEALL